MRFYLGPKYVLCDNIFKIKYHDVNESAFLFLCVSNDARNYNLIRIALFNYIKYYIYYVVDNY